jgi:hypothetical protein
MILSLKFLLIFAQLLKKLFLHFFRKQQGSEAHPKYFIPNENPTVTKFNIRGRKQGEDRSVRGPVDGDSWL